MLGKILGYLIKLNLMGALQTFEPRYCRSSDRIVQLTTWLIWETLDWRMVTASPIEGFLEAAATWEVLKPMVVRAVSWDLVASLENIL